MPELLAANSEIIAELRRREIIRTGNAPLGDYTEWLVAQKLGLKLTLSSSKGHDATDAEGVRYQIKGRRLGGGRKQAQLSAIRALDQGDFDFLIAVLFDESWQIIKAAKVAHADIARLSKYRGHVNAHVLTLGTRVFEDPTVLDITQALVN